MSEKPENESHSKNDKPLEYFIVATTNPYIGEKERNALTTVLCEKIISELEGGPVAVKILSHKILSPDQAEALLTLNVIDQCVRNCGQKVWNEIARFRFLNQFVRLLSPKYMGLETSDAVRNRAVELLFTWKNSMRHLSKIDEVYNILKEQGVIERDPEIATDIPNCPKPSRLAFFEDEEKAQLLSELLKSKNPEDLQAANRLIKSMVRSEDLRVERMSKRRECMDKAEGSCQVLTEMLDEFTVFSRSDYGVMKEIYTDLLAVRPMLFRYAGEAAENDDDSLADVLSVNDVVNRTIQRYKSIVEPANVPEVNGTTKSSDRKEVDLLGISTDSHRPTPSNSCLSRTSDVDDDALIGFSVASSPAVPRKKSEHDEPKPKSSLDELLGNLVERAFSSNNRPTDIAVTDHTSSILPRPSDPFSPTRNGEVPRRAVKVPSTLENISLELTDIVLDFKRTPLVVFDEFNVKVVLYPGGNDQLPSTIHPFIAAITNTNCYDLEAVRLILASSCTSIKCKILPARNDILPAFNPLGVQQNISQVFLLDVGQLAPKHKITVRFDFGYSLNGAQNDFSGEFPVML